MINGVTWELWRGASWTLSHCHLSSEQKHCAMVVMRQSPASLCSGCSFTISITTGSSPPFPMLHTLMLTQGLPQVDSSFQLWNVHWKDHQNYLNWPQKLPFSLWRLKPEWVGTSCSEQLLLIQTASPSPADLQYTEYPRPTLGLQHQ